MGDTGFQLLVVSGVPQHACVSPISATLFLRACCSLCQLIGLSPIQVLTCLSLLSFPSNQIRLVQMMQERQTSPLGPNGVAFRVDFQTKTHSQALEVMV